MKLLNIAKSFSAEDERKQESAGLQEEAKNFDLAGNGGFLTFAKYAIYTLLGALNFRLFFVAVGGLWGIAIGLTAIMSEAFAIYCWNNQHKSSGKHRLALQFFSVAFTFVSVVHGAASLYEMLQLGPSIKGAIFWYSHAVAFPLIFGLMIVALFVLGFTHWSAAVAKERAKAQVDIASSRAGLLTKTANLSHESQLAHAELDHFKEKLAVEHEMTAMLEDVATLEVRKQKAVSAIADPAVRDRLQRLLGVIQSPQSEPVLAKDKRTMTMAPPPQSFTQSGATNFYTPDETGK
jgi:hypothetical protein